MKSRAYLDSPTVINLGRQDATCGSFTQVTCINFNAFTVQSHAHLLGKRSTQLSSVEYIARQLCRIAQS